MKEVLQANLTPEAEKAQELGWLKEHIAVFWPTAYAGYYTEGRGAVVIDTTAEPLGENTPFYYVQQAQFEAQADAVSHRMATLIAEYEPEHQFIAVFIRPGVDEFEFSMFQLGMGEAVIEVTKLVSSNPSPLSEKSLAEAPLEPPDLDTLMAWENDGGCEAACPHQCWVEPDGRCSHGHPSWLLKLGLI